MKKYWLFLWYWFNFAILYFYCWSIPKKKTKTTKIGSRNGGWCIPLELITKKSICYCAGAGEDITFDLGLIKKKSCSVFCFDPTPRAKKHVELYAKSCLKFKFLPIGLWKENKTLKFYAPENPNFVSHSVTNLHQTKTFFLGKCQRLITIMKKLKHTNLDLLKIDIEGAEYAVLTDMLESGIFPHVLCIEFDQPTPVIYTIKMINLLSKNGFYLVNQDHFNFTFIHD